MMHFDLGDKKVVQRKHSRNKLILTFGYLSLTLLYLFLFLTFMILFFSNMGYSALIAIQRTALPVLLIGAVIAPLQFGLIKLKKKQLELSRKLQAFIYAERYKM